jgi:hypothetical protein
MLGVAVLSTILYVMTFLRLRGNLVRSGWKLSFRRVGDSPDKYFSNDQTMLVAKQMLLFPVSRFKAKLWWKQKLTTSSVACLRCPDLPYCHCTIH